jgi:hypothetical protein
MKREIHILPYALMIMMMRMTMMTIMMMMWLLFKEFFFGSFFLSRDEEASPTFFSYSYCKMILPLFYPTPVPGQLYPLKTRLQLGMAIQSVPENILYCT